MRLSVFIFALFLFACKSKDTGPVSIVGAYNMRTQNVKGEKFDTTYSVIEQMKIYTPDMMMYANWNPTDSNSHFGVGSYTVEKDTLTEHVLYSAGDSVINSTAADYKLIIEKTDNGYKQIIPDMMNGTQKYTLTETYETATPSATSILDGVWEMTKAYTLTGKDTVPDNRKQFKAYFGSRFIFAHTYLDSAKKAHTGVGFGTFAMTGNDKVKETVLTSTYDIRGRSFNLDVSMEGTDAYSQTITDTSGAKTVEYYKRMKK